jgi:hypothetical protein
MEQSLKSEYGIIDYELAFNLRTDDGPEIATRRLTGKIAVKYFGSECFCEIETEIRDWDDRETNCLIPFRIIRKIEYITREEYLNSLQEHRKDFPAKYQGREQKKSA